METEDILARRIDELMKDRQEEISNLVSDAIDYHLKVFETGKGGDRYRSSDCLNGIERYLDPSEDRAEGIFPVRNAIVTYVDYKIHHHPSPYEMYKKTYATFITASAAGMVITSQIGPMAALAGFLSVIGTSVMLITWGWKKSEESFETFLGYKEFIRRGTFDEQISAAVESNREKIESFVRRYDG